MTFKGELLTGVGAAAAALIVVAVLSYGSLIRNVEDRKWVTHTYEVLEKLDYARISFSEAETSERGYLLTGRDAHLEVYRNAVAGLGGRLKELRELTVDNPRQQAALRNLAPLILEKLASMQSQIGTRDAGGLAAAAGVVEEGSGKTLMDEIRAGIAGIKGEEDRLLVLRSAELESSSRATRRLIVVGEAMGFCFLFLAGVVIFQEMRKRATAETEIRRLNADLERRVEERTTELGERAKELERSNLELQQFAYVASHDLQEPLRTISSFTQLLAKRYQNQLDDKAREFINFAVDGCKRMQMLINDLLSFSRVGTQGKEFAAVSCEAALERVLKMMKLTIEGSKARITKDPLPIVLADELQLCQLLQNLIGNAIKFKGEDAPRIHISAEAVGIGWKIAVRDNGIGIAPEQNDRIFIIFQRLHTKMQYPGTGIGLAICKKIAERHGGKIWVEPDPEGGSVFYFTIYDGKSKNLEAREQNALRIAATAH